MSAKQVVIVLDSDDDVPCPPRPVRAQGDGEFIVIPDNEKEIGEAILKAVMDNSLPLAKGFLASLGKSGCVDEFIPEVSPSTSILEGYLQKYGNSGATADEVVSTVEFILGCCDIVPKFRLIEFFVSDPNLKMRLRRAFLGGPNKQADVNERCCVTRKDRFFHAYPGFNTPVSTAIKDKNMEYLKLLVDNGADIGEIKINGRNSTTPLQCAIDSNNTEALDYLIKHGADVNMPRMVKGEKTYTPLKAALVIRNSMIKPLVMAGATVDEDIYQYVKNMDAPVKAALDEAVKARAVNGLYSLAAAADMVERDDAGSRPIDALIKVAASEAMARKRSRTSYRADKLLDGSYVKNDYGDFIVYVNGPEPEFSPLKKASCVPTSPDFP